MSTFQFQRTSECLESLGNFNDEMLHTEPSGEIWLL